NRLLGVKLTPAAMIEHPERRVAALLNLGDHEARADRVDRPGRDDDSVVRRHGLPANKVADRAVVDGVPQLLWRETSIEAESDFGSRDRAQHVPGFGLAARQSHLVRKRIVGMDLNGKRLIS